MTISPEKIKQLEQKAKQIRRTVIEALVNAGSGHLAGALGMADVFTYLFFHTLEQDRLIISNGHICPVIYAAMAHAGYFPTKDLIGGLRKFGTPFQGHPDRRFLRALETSSGPLGEGLSQAVGMALVDNHKFFYCLMSDAELQEGNTWEAAMLAAKEKLGNLIAIVDRNKIQIDGWTEKIMPLEPLREKWEAFNWHTAEINGHDFQELDAAISAAKTFISKPSIIIAHTIPGKGVKEFENKPEWHGRAPNREEGKQAIEELKI